MNCSICNMCMIEDTATNRSLLEDIVPQAYGISRSGVLDVITIKTEKYAKTRGDLLHDDRRHQEIDKR